MTKKAKKKTQDFYVAPTAIVDEPEEFSQCMKDDTHYEVNMYCNNCGYTTYARVRKGVDAYGLKCPHCECERMSSHVKPPPRFKQDIDDLI